MNSKIKKILSLVFVLIISFSLTSCQGFFLIGDEETSTSTTVSTTTESQTPYEEAVSKGYRGSYTEWLVEIFETEEYKSIWSELKEDGKFTGTLTDFVSQLKGEAGSTDVHDAATEGLLSAVTITSTATKTITVSNRWGYGSSQIEASGGCSGSGVIIKDERVDGQKTGVAYIITNFHVCYVELSASNVTLSNENKYTIATSIYVNLYGMDLSSQRIEATYLGGSGVYDIAVLKIDSNLYKNNIHKPCTIGDSDKLSAGESIIAVGNSNGEGTSVTSGIISVPYDVISMAPADKPYVGSSEYQTYKEIRIDASVNPGNSGGGLYDMDGKLIGIVNAKEVDEDTEGMCYALPINISIAVANKIMSECNGVTVTKVKKALLGITIERKDSTPVYDSATNSINIVSSICVSEISTNSICLNKLQKDDKIVSIKYNGKTYDVSTLYSMEVVLLLAEKDSQMDINIIRVVDSTETAMTVTVTLSNDTEI